MAKARPIRSLRADEPFFASAARVFPVRIDELWHWAEHLPWPERTRELHDLRIAAKRLRYALEFYTPCFKADLAPLLEALKHLQDLAGAVHDYDVWLARFRQPEAAGGPDRLVEDLEQLRRRRHSELLAVWGDLEAAGFRQRIAEVVASAGPEVVE